MIEEILLGEENLIEEKDVTNEECFNVEVLAKQDNKQNMKFADIKFGRKVKVFAKINSEGFITDISNDIFLNDLTGWTQIDEGCGDRYYYPQTKYFDAPLIDDNGNYKFKI